MERQMLQRLNNNYTSIANEENQDEDEINSMIEEQIERESGACTAKTGNRGSTGTGRRRGTGYGK